MILVLLCSSVVSAGSAPLLSWHQVGSPSDGTQGDPLPAKGIAFGNSQFVAVKGPNVGGTYNSMDGLTWSEHDIDGVLERVFYRNGLWMAPNRDTIDVSDDGQSWRVGVSLNRASTNVLDIAYGKGRYVAGLYMSDPVVISADLQTVTDSQWPITPHKPMRGVTFGKRLFVGGAGNGLFYSVDGLIWTVATQVPEDVDFVAVAFGAGRFVAVGQGVQDASGVVYTSVDGKNWAETATTSSNLTGVIYGGGRFVIWGPESLLTATDGQQWSTATNPAGQATLAYGAGRFIAAVASQTLMTAVACGTRFPDLASDYLACDAVEQLARQSIISGYPDGTFRPGASVTRAELTKMLVLTLGLTPNPNGTLPFSDTAGHWAAEAGYLQTAVAWGIINGYPDGTFRPDQPVTRAELTKMVVAAAGLTPESGSSYSDIMGSEWFAGWVAAARHADLVGPGGYHPLWTQAAFQGTSSANRGESATLLDNLQNY